MSEAQAQPQLTDFGQKYVINKAINTYKAIQRKNFIQKGSSLVTLDDLYDAFYPWRSDPNYFKTPEWEIQKARDPFLTTDTGATNVVYGELVWNQLDMEANAFGLLPKAAWGESGIRFLAAHAATGGGIAEDADLPLTDHPEMALGYSNPATIVHTFDISLEQQLMDGTRDDNPRNSKQMLRDYTAAKHRSDINAYTLSEANVLSAENPETLDRMVNATAVVTAGLIDAGDEDFENVDRSDNAWADAYVDHNSGTDRDLTPELIRDLLRGTRRFQDIPNSQKIFLTTEETFHRISAQYEGQNYFKQGEVNFQPTVNGIQAPYGGQDAGFMVSTLYGYPIIVSKDVQEDTIGRLYFLDLGHTRWDVLLPTQYFESGVSMGQPRIVNKINDHGTFVTMGQLRCTKFKAHGVVRDLK